MSNTREGYLKKDGEGGGLHARDTIFFFKRNRVYSCLQTKRREGGKKTTTKQKNRANAGGGKGDGVRKSEGKLLLIKREIDPPVYYSSMPGASSSSERSDRTSSDSMSSSSSSESSAAASAASFVAWRVTYSIERNPPKKNEQLVNTLHSISYHYNKGESLVPLTLFSYEEESRINMDAASPFKGSVGLG